MPFATVTYQGLSLEYVAVIFHILLSDLTLWEGNTWLRGVYLWWSCSTLQQCLRQ